MQASYGMIIFPFWYLDQIKEKKNYWNVQSSTTENCSACSLCGNYSNFVTTQEVKNRPISTPYTIYWCCGYFLTINFTPWNYEFTSFSIPSVSNKETIVAVFFNNRRLGEAKDLNTRHSFRCPIAGGKTNTTCSNLANHN